MRFNELGLSAEIVSALDEMGFESPTPIQEKAIPELISGSVDLMGLAQTGTGKTAAFGLPMLHLLETEGKKAKLQALILSPTRELCIQIYEDLKKFSKYQDGVKVTSVYGGTSIDNQIKALNKGVHVVVATPGRLVDLINRKKIDLKEVKRVVLDEADEMLNMGFKDDLDIILEQTPKTKNTWLFSATMPQEVRRIAKNYMFEPLELTVGKANAGNANIEHHYIIVQRSDRYLALKRVLDFYPEVFGLIFCQTKMDTKEVAEKLIADGYSADALHGDLSQAQRDGVMKKFRSNSIQILVATDVAARGIDVNNITHVINYGIPDDREAYTHRAGRTGRAGNKGIAISIGTKRDIGKVKGIERQINLKMNKSFVPNGKEICQKQLFHLIENVKSTQVNHQEIDPYLAEINEKFADLTKEQIIEQFISVEFNRFLSYYEKDRDINVSDRELDFDKHSKDTKRLYINLGSLDDFDKGSMLKFVCDAARIESKQVGRIDIMRSYSFVELDNAIVDQALEILNHITYQDRDVKVEISKDRRGGGGGRSRGNFGGGGGGYRKGGGGGGYRKEGSGGGYRKGGGDRDRKGGGDFKSKDRKPKDSAKKSKYHY